MEEIVMANSPEELGAGCCEKGMLVCGAIWGIWWVLKKAGEKAAEHAVPLIIIGIVIVGIFIATRLRKTSQRKQMTERKQEDSQN